MAAVMQAHRPSMDRSTSFDQPRRMHSPYAQQSSHYEHHARTPSPSARSPYLPSHPPAQHSRPSFGQHSRTSSNSSSIHKPSPYSQPQQLQNSYFPQQQSYPVQSQPWAASAIPSTAFYSTPFQAYGANPVFHPGFQQSQGDFAAWASAYQHMMMASASAQSLSSTGGTSQNPYSEMSSPHAEYLQEERRRRGSDPHQPTSRLSFDTTPDSHQSRIQAQQSQSGGFHPYKRTPGHRPSRENIHASVPRSVSQPSIPTAANSTSSSQSAHKRSPSDDSGAPVKQQNSVRASDPPARQQDTPSVVTRVVSPKPKAVAASTAPSTTTSSMKTVTPLQTGPITNAINTPAAARSSPLAQSPIAPSPEPEKKGLKSRLRKVLATDAAAKKASTPPPASPVKSTLQPKIFASPSETSTRSATPPVTPPQHNDDDLPTPTAPFSVNHQGAMNSDVSLAETARTATTAATDFGGPGKEKKKSLFRMKNMSTDNISLSSTVSSASMMIRKMGSLGKLARRNSLAGISKIFKEKPKDEDGPLPEKEIKKREKKEKKDKKKNQSKGEIAPATISHAIAEHDRNSTEEDDRALAGLSPAAKLARQHTLRSKAEAEAEAARKRAAAAQPTGEPTWDNNTATRAGPPHLPGISAGPDSVSAPFPNGTPASPTGPEVLRVQPRHTQTVHRAVHVNVADGEYDSDDSSDGETIEDVTIGMASTRLSVDTDRTSLNGARSTEGDEDFKARWGNAWIDKNAVPKKGILKHAASFTEGASQHMRNLSVGGRAPIPIHANTAPYSSSGLTRDPNSLSSLEGELGAPSPTRARFNSDFDFDFNSPSSPSQSHLYANPAHNTSAPSLTLASFGHPALKPPATSRSMTVPARKRLNWAPECAVYSTYDAGTYDRRSEPATCNRLTPELAMAIKQELNAFKLEMPVHPASKINTHYFAW